MPLVQHRPTYNQDKMGDNVPTVTLLTEGGVLKRVVSDFEARVVECDLDRGEFGFRSYPASSVWQVALRGEGPTSSHGGMLAMKDERLTVFVFFKDNKVFDVASNASVRIMRCEKEEECSVSTMRCHDSTELLVELAKLTVRCPAPPEPAGSL